MSSVRYGSGRLYLIERMSRSLFLPVLYSRLMRTVPVIS